MKFKLQHYNEFKSAIRWHDYFNFSINEFHILTFRRYDFNLLDTNPVSGYFLTILGFSIKVLEKGIE